MDINDNTFNKCLLPLVDCGSLYQYVQFYKTSSAWTRSEFTRRPFNHVTMFVTWFYDLLHNNQ